MILEKIFVDWTHYSDPDVNKKLNKENVNPNTLKKECRDKTTLNFVNIVEIILNF